MKALPVTPDQPEVGTWVLLWENKTWLKGYRLYNGWRIIYADGQFDYSPESVSVTHWADLPPEPGDESPSSDPAEVLVKALENIRKSMPTGSWFAKTIDKALSEYEQLKQKQS